MLTRDFFLEHSSAALLFALMIRSKSAFYFVDSHTNNLITKRQYDLLQEKVSLNSDYLGNEFNIESRMNELYSKRKDCFALALKKVPGVWNLYQEAIKRHQHPEEIEGLLNPY